jgi:hypothetical protein
MWPRRARRSTRFLAWVLVLTGLAAAVGVLVAMLGAANSYRDAVAGTMWLTGFLALLVVSGQLRGQFWAAVATWGMDDDDTAELESESESESFASFVLIPAGIVVLAIGTIVYVL